MKTKITKEQANLIKNLFIAGYIAFLVARVDIYLAKKEKPVVEAETQSYEAVNEDKMVASQSESYYPTSPTQNAVSDAKSNGKKDTKIDDTERIPTKEEIEGYIREVFGEQADKAFLLLKGKGEGTCAENRNLDPNAVNDNTWWGGKGKDWGIFQINDVYHPVFKLNLHKDWKANVDYAYRMYLRDGKSFRRWTCGKYYMKTGDFR